MDEIWFDNKIKTLKLLGNEILLYWEKYYLLKQCNVHLALTTCSDVK